MGSKDVVVVQAVLDGLKSLPRAVRSGDFVRLELASTVSAVGSVGPNPNGEGVELSVTCFAIDGVRRVLVGTRRTAIGAPWEMPDLPMPPLGRYIFRFEGDSTTPVERHRTATAPGETIRVDIDIQPGSTSSVRVVDEERKPLPAVEVVATYTNIFSRVVSFSAFTDDEGLCLLKGVPPREGDLIARKAGYAVSPYGWPIHGLLPADEVWEITMTRAPPLRGRCLADGEPVRDFDLIWWPDGLYRSETREFRGVESGEFELLELPAGDVSLVATSDQFGETAATLISLPPSGLADVVLEFPARAVITGVVLDAFTEQPIPDATIQPWAISTTKYLAARGNAVQVDARGAFRAEGFNVGLNRFEVSAPDYAPRMHGVFVESGKEGDAGIIRLARSQSLEIELRVGADNVITECYATGTSGSSVLQPKGFDANGRLRYDGVAPGMWTIRASLYTGVQLISLVELIPGRDWRVVVDAERLAPWNLVLRDSRGVGLSTDYGVRLTWSEGGVPTRIGSYLGDGGELSFWAPRGAVSTLRVFGPNSSWLHQATVCDAEYQQDPYVVQIGERAASFRVVENNSTPIAGATVYLLIPGLGYEAAISATTTADGLASVTAPASGPVDVGVFHPTLGLAAFIGLGDDDQQSGLYELELDPVAPMEVLVRDGAIPVAGAELGLGKGGYWMSRPRTDGAGLTKTVPLNGGAWRVRFDQPGYWPTEGEFLLKKGSKPFELQVRRLSDLEFEVRDAAGLAVSDVEIGLVSDEFHESAGDWLAQGRITSSTGSMRTDRSGKLTVRGAPHGKYRWSVLAGDEVRATDWVTAPPLGVASVDARLP